MINKLLLTIIIVSEFLLCEKMTRRDAEFANHDQNMKLNLIYIIKCTTNKKPKKAFEY